jgi:hypothetical protein
VKEDELYMQRHVQEENDKKRLAEEATKRAEEKALEEERKAQKEAAKAEETPEEPKE